jgi:hypothetical protein
MTGVDPRLVVLLRAGAKFELVEAGLDDLDEAFADIERAVHNISPCQYELREKSRRVARHHSAALEINYEA